MGEMLPLLAWVCIGSQAGMAEISAHAVNKTHLFQSGSRMEPCLLFNDRLRQNYIAWRYGLQKLV